jgi:hypothetical protein
LGLADFNGKNIGCTGLTGFNSDGLGCIGLADRKTQRDRDND